MKRNNKALYEQIMRSVSREIKKVLNEQSIPQHPMEDSDILNIFVNWAKGNPYTFNFTENDYIQYLNTIGMYEYESSANIDPIFDTNEYISNIIFDYIDDREEIYSEYPFDYRKFFDSCYSYNFHQLQIMVVIKDIINGDITPEQFNDYLNGKYRNKEYSSPYNNFVNNFIDLSQTFEEEDK